jgi:ribonuclease BN (tRNA processing enzyme)
MEVVFLGTNGWYDTETGNTVCTMVRTDCCYLILDAGNGIYKVERYMDAPRPVHLFLSHFHLDHVAGLHILNKFRFQEGLNIYGQEGTRRVLEILVAEPFTVPLAKLPYPVHVRELSQGRHELPFPVECRYLSHASPCLGYRFEMEGTTIAYCADTGICENAIRLAEGADLLIAECSFLPGEQNPGWPHLNPEDAADIARSAGARRLALVHFDADRYRTLAEREAAAESAGFEDLVVARDGMVLEL